MAEVRTFKQLEKLLKLKIQQAMEDEVATKSVQLGQKNVAEEVYSKYDPVVYNRSMEMMTAFEVEPTKDGIEFSHDRRDGDRYVSEIVETGEGYQFYKEGAAYLEPRPFFATTVEDLENGEFKKALKSGLINKGLKVE